MNALNKLKQYSQIVIDTSELDLIQQSRPIDCTTNPSLILKASQRAEYSSIVDEVISQFYQRSTDIEYIAQALVVKFGVRISTQIEGLISSEVDARWSFDTQKTIEQAHDILQQYSAKGILRDRILIKIAATWEGIQACRELQKQNIQCNMTLVFNQCQALACAQAGAYLISPFVGRIFDWHQARQDVPITIEKDPGVASVKAIYTLLKQYGYTTIVMAASFRRIEQILALSGCDKLTISPILLQELQQTSENVTCQLGVAALTCQQPPKNLTESDFRQEVDNDTMTAEKLAEGIHLFSRDGEALRELVRQRLQAL